MAVRTLQVAIIDDEPLARYKIRALLDLNDELNVVGEANDSKSAILLIDDAKPDLIFLDVQMPDGTGIDVLKAAKHEPGVIFTTAFDSYAITAFEVGAVDYLLKPFSRVRFQQALLRAQAAVKPGGAVGLRKKSEDPADHGARIERLFVPTRIGTVNIDIADIEYFQGQGDYVQLSSNKRTHLVPIKLKEFEEKLDGSLFLRIHRSFIVNIHFVDTITSIGNGRYCVRMKGGTDIRASRKGSQRLRELIQRP